MWLALDTNILAYADSEPSSSLLDNILLKNPGGLPPADGPAFK